MQRRNIGVVFIMSIFSLFCLPDFVGSGQAERHFSDRDLRGSYGYSFEADFGPGLTQRAVEAGLFTADGKGTLNGIGTAVTNGLGPIEATYSCSYVVDPDGRVPVVCDRTTIITGTVPVQFILILADRRREAPFVGIPTQGPFEFLRLIGMAIKQ